MEARTLLNIWPITEGELDGEAIQILSSALLVHIFYGTFKNRYAVFSLFIPLIIDSDHLLPLYSSGIKAFHSMFFITILISPFICYGLLKLNREAIYSGAVVYVVSILNISIDLLQGGKISFLYPFSSTSYVLSALPSQEMTGGELIALLLFLSSGVFLLHESLWHEDHRGRFYSPGHSSHTPFTVRHHGRAH